MQHASIVNEYSVCIIYSILWKIDEISRVMLFQTQQNENCFAALFVEILIVKFERKEERLTSLQV